MSPVFLEDFVNSLCVVQIMDIPDHVDALKDFKPRREAALSRLRTDVRAEVTTIIEDANANTVEEKARTIYNWICDNIAYDTTKQIHDAETCYISRRGVCQAYCELFCYMAEAVGMTADVIVGITKDGEGNISLDLSRISSRITLPDGSWLLTWNDKNGDPVQRILKASDRSTEY